MAHHPWIRTCPVLWCTCTGCGPGNVSSTKWSIRPRLRCASKTQNGYHSSCHLGLYNIISSVIILAIFLVLTGYTEKSTPLPQGSTLHADQSSCWWLRVQTIPWIPGIALMIWTPSPCFLPKRLLKESYPMPKCSWLIDTLPTTQRV